MLLGFAVARSYTSKLGCETELKHSYKPNVSSAKASVTRSGQH